MSERDLAAEIDALAKRVEDLEDAEDVRHSKAEAAQTEGRVSHEEILKELALPDGVGEAPAVNVCDDSHLWKMHAGFIRTMASEAIEAYFGRRCDEYEPNCECCKRWKLLDDLLHDPADVDESPRLDDAFPIPAPVEQGPTTGMKAAINFLVDECDYGPNQSDKESLLRILVVNIGPELAAKDAEIVRLKADNVLLRDDYQVAVNNIGYRSQELKEARAEVERLRQNAGLAIKTRDRYATDLIAAEAKLAEGQGYWKCYHCGFVAKTKAEADSHFGDESGVPALCVEWGKLDDQDRASLLQGTSIELEGARCEISSLAAKLAEAEKELERRQSVIDDWNSWRDKLTAESVPTPGMKAAVDHACIGAGASGSTLLRIIVQYVGPEFQVLQQQLSASTAANVERDRAAEAMEWLTQNDCSLHVVYSPVSSGFQKVWRVETFPGRFDTPTAAILAAKAAAEGNG